MPSLPPKKKILPIIAKDSLKIEIELFPWRAISHEKLNILSVLVAKNQFPRAEIRFLLKRLLPPNIKLFNGVLNKILLFLLDRKSVYTSQNEKFVEKTFLLGETVFTAWNISLIKKRLFTSQKSSFY